MLPSVEQLAELPSEIWATLRRRLTDLRISADTLNEVGTIAAGVSPLLRAPMRRWHLRQRSGEQALWLRCLFFHDPIRMADAEATFGTLLEPLLRAGLLHEGERGVSSPFDWTAAGSLILISDFLRAGGDAVMGHTQTTRRLVRAALPPRGERIGSVVDIGCGAGSVGLSLAQHAERVVGTDINPRALALAKYNALLNEIGNVEWREGDGFAPVHGESFDCIVCQPPFVSHPESAAPATYLYGGARGDELAMQLLGSVPSHLTKGGRAVFLVEWPEFSEQRVEERVRGAVDDDSFNVLILESPRLSVDEHCLLMATTKTEDIGSLEFEQEAMARRDHLHRLGVEGLRSTFVVVSAARTASWTRTVECRVGAAELVTGERIRRLNDGQELCTQGDVALIGAKLRLPKGTQMRELAGMNPPKVQLVLPPASLLSDLILNAPTARLLEWVEVSETVDAALEQAIPQASTAPRVRTEALRTVASLLEAGVLEVN